MELSRQIVRQPQGGAKGFDIERSKSSRRKARFCVPKRGR
jgi:hypothetical protein